jgi:hypothetical protein
MIIAGKTALLGSAMKQSPGQILISARVLTKVENSVTVEPVGEFALKGHSPSDDGLQCAQRISFRKPQVNTGSISRREVIEQIAVLLQCTSSAFGP